MARCPILVLGSGAWGTALAIHLARLGQPTVLWGREPKAQAVMQADRENKAYLPGYRFPPALTIITEFQSQLWHKVLIVVPSDAFVAILCALKPYLAAHAEVVWATKGLGQGRFLHEIAQEQLGSIDIGVLSGPSFAKEVAQGAFTALVLASESEALAKQWQAFLHTPYFRVYLSQDLTGVALGGTLKNVLALAVGIAEGLGLGVNARAALITRGLAEMMRLGEALGAKRETLVGLSGLGDLVLSATDHQSRNRRCGVLLGQGLPLAQALDQIGQVVESVYNSTSLVNLAKQRSVELPICEAVDRVLHANDPPQEALMNLILRPACKE